MIELERLEMTTTACPTQWEGWDADGTEYYIRFRWGYLTVTKGGVAGTDVYAQQVSDGLDGVMDTETMLQHTGIKVAG